MKIVLLILAAGIIWYFTSQFINSGKAKKNIELGQLFLEKNNDVDGVVTTASGLQYQVLEKGDGSTHPTAKDRVKVHYHGTLIDSTVLSLIHI